MVYILALVFVVIGIVNSTPVIPGWDAMWQKITGIEKLKTRAFATEWVLPAYLFYHDAFSRTESFDLAGMARTLLRLVRRFYGRGTHYISRRDFSDLFD